MRFRELCALLAGPATVGLILLSDATPTADGAVEPRAAVEIADRVAPASDDEQTSSPESSGRIRFNFKDASFEQVIEFFSRETGLPVIWESDPPEGTLNYLSQDSYERREALRVLNIILQSRGVMLRISDDMLYLRSLDDMQRADVPTYVGHIPDDITDEQIVTIVKPLANALAKPLAERMAQMVAQYGSVTAMEQQNSLVITETAAQVRRLLRIVEELDREDPEGAVEIFKIEHARAADLMEPLTALMSQRVERFVIDQRGEQQRIEEDQMHGLNISHDPRTNSIIARGTQSRIDNLRESIALLDVPAATGARSIRTVTLAVLSPQDAVNRLNQVYQKLPEAERPTVLPLNEFGQVTIVGHDQAIAEGVAVLREIDGGDETTEPIDVGRRVAVHVLDHADPDGLITAMRGLLNSRQLHATKIVAGPDGRSVILSGPAADVAAIESIVPTLDRPARVDRHVRVLELKIDEPQQMLNRAKEIYEEQIAGDEETLAVSTRLDEASRTLTVIGSNEALNRFNTVLQGLQATAVQREIRQIRTQHARPSELAETLRELAARMNAARGFASDTDPTIDAFDDLDLLLITATGEQHQSISPLIESLDVPKDRTMPPLRILQLRLTDAQNLSNILTRQYQQRPADERTAKPVSISADPATNSLIVAAHPEILPEIQGVVEELNEEQRDIDGREIRIFPLKVARARELARTIDEMFPEPPMPRDARGRPMPHLQQPREIVVRGDEQTNSLIVDAPIARMAGFEQLVEQLDRQQIMEETEIRNYQIVHVEIDTVASTLRDLANAGTLSPAGRDRRVPITVTTEPMSRTLIVAGPSDIFERVEDVLDDLDARPTGPATQLRFYKLEHARAENVADMLRQVLMTRITEDVPEAGADVRNLLNVTADRKTNTLILSAPEAIIPIAEELIRQLDDQTSAMADPVVRVLPMTFADARDVSQSIQQASREMISPVTGEKMQVRITASPGANALLLVGLEQDLKELEQLIEPLDERPTMDALDAKTYALEHADAATIAPIIQRLLTDQMSTDPWVVRERIRRTRGEYDFTPQIRVEADERTNSVIVSAPQRTVVLAETLIRELDRPDDVVNRTYETYTPSSANPADLARAAERILQRTRPEDQRQKIELFPESQSGAVVVIGSEDQAAEAMALLKRLDDRALTPPQMDFRIVTLDHSEANVIAQTVRPMLTDRQRWPEELRSLARAGIAVSQPTVTADRANNRLLISAPQELMPTAHHIIGELDQPRTDGAALNVRIFHLTQAKADDVADAVRSAMDAKTQAAPGSLRVNVTSEASSNSLIVTGSEKQLAEIERIIEPLDQGMAIDQLQVRTVFLKHARAETVAPTVRELLAGEELPVWIRYDAARFQRQLPETGPEVRVAADTRLNAVIVSAPPAVLNIAEEMIAQLDADPQTIDGAKPRMVRVLTIHNADARELSSNLEAIFAEAGQLDPPPTIRVDAASNSLLVRATESQFRTIEEVAESIDRATVATSRQMQMIRIDPAKATADEVARTLKRLLDRSEGSSVEVITVDELRKRQQRNRSESRESSSLPERFQSPRPTPTLAGIIVQTFIGLIHDETSRTNVFAIDDGADITIAIDESTNSIIVIGSPRAVERLTQLAGEVQDQLPADPETIRYVPLPDGVEAGHMARLTNQTLARMTPAGGERGDYRRRVSILADQVGNALIIAANDRDFETVGELITALSDTRTTDDGFEIRTIVLERASAAAVANAIQQLYDDRARITARMRGRREIGRQIAIVGDEASRTVLVAATEEEFEQVERLAEQFDSPQATDALEFRVFELKHARANEIRQTVQGLINDMNWNQPGMRFRPMQQQRDRGMIAVRADSRLNALIVTGTGDHFGMVEPIIDMLDQPEADHAKQIVKLYPVRRARLDLIADVVRESFVPDRPWWQQAEPTDVRVRNDERNNILIVSATETEHEEIGDLIEQIDGEMAAAEHDMAVLTLEYAAADEIASTMQQFLRDRARATNEPESTATIIASRSANSLIVSAAETDLHTIEDLLTRLDQPNVSGDRVVEIIALQEGRSQDIARIMREQFPRRAGQGVIVTPDVRTNSLIINAPQQQLAEAKALIDQLDTPPATDETIIRTYALEGARAEEARRLLAQTLQLDDRGRTAPGGISIKLEEADLPAIAVTARIVADRRSNSLIVTATEPSFPVIEHLIRQIDEVPSVSPVEYRLIRLEHAMADDVSFTLRQMMRATEPGETAPRIDYNRMENQLIVAATSDQFEQIERILGEIDVPSEHPRMTRFLPLEFAEATQVQEALSRFYGPFAFDADTPGKRNVQIVADPATNSLVISAPEDEWDGIHALLSDLDSEEYDASLQLRVLPLMHADAASVARAINDAFAGMIERGPRYEQHRQRRHDDDRRDQELPAVLVESEEWVRASAEPLTNAVVVSASRQNIRKIEQIVEQLDVADFAKLPAPRIIPVTTGHPEQLAQSLNRLYDQTADRGRAAARQALRIVADQSSNTVIVRATDEEFQQIRALAEALQQEAGDQGVSVRVLRLTAAPAARVAEAVREAYQTKARRTNQPLSIQVDAQGNTLIIASTGALFQEIEETAEQLDAMFPGGGAGQGIFIIDLENISPEEAKSVVETIGLHQPQPADSMRRLVTEPIRISVLRGRNAVMVVASPADRETVVGLLKAIDTEPEMAESAVRIVRLQRARADSLAQMLGRILRPADQQAETALARAIREQVRRLNVRRDGVNEHDLNLDLTKPIRIIPDANMNALVVSSTAENVAAIEELIELFDKLPITDAVTVQMFPLENISADQFARIVRDLFQQGRQLGRIPGTDIMGVPAGMAGKALLDEIAITTDERTNTVIAAGKEETVALVEVLTKRLDSDIATGWVEPRIVPLRFADASDLAETLRAVLIEGQTNLPQAAPLQQQIGRLRMARQEPDGGRVLESDVFQRMTRLVIRPEPQLNALILVGTPINLELVTELVNMLDVEAASPSATVRIYPVEHASASRLAQTITRLFDQQVQSKAIREEDRAIVQADERTNSLIVTTSARSFAVLESLLDSLDQELAPDLREIRRIELQHASATRLAGLIQQMMNARLDRLRRVQPETADLEQATVIAEPRTNALIIAAGKESFEVIRRLATDLDESTLADAATVHVLPVEKGNIDRIAAAINQIMDRRYADQPQEIRRSQTPLVLTDPRTNSLLVAANPEDLQSIENLVDRLAEAPVSPAVGLHVVSVDPATSVEQLANRLQRLMQERAQSLGEARTPSDRVSIEPHPTTNSLIIAANEENLGVIDGLISMLVEAEAESPVGREVDLFLLTKSRATEMVSLLNELHVREANRQRGENIVRITADERLNAVLVNAPASDVDILRNLIGRLDGTKPAHVVETKFITLEAANALETVNLIENVLSGRGIGTTRASEQATILRYIREIAHDTLGEVAEEIAATEMEVGAAIRENITLTPDVRTNTVIVTAPRDSMRLIEQMVRDLDASSVGSQNIRIFKLANADAIATAQILTDLFSLQRQGNLYVLRPRESVQDNTGAEDGPAHGDAAMPGLSGIELTAVPDERQLLSITVDTRTNALLVSGTPSYLDLVQQVVHELDQQEAMERQTFVYPLRNAEAEDVAEVVTNFIDREQEKLIGTLGVDQLGSAARLLEREITIVGDEKSNSVLVSASPRYMQTVRDMIEQLDVDPPQVLIQVMLAEVTLDDTFDWGVDFGFRAQADSATITGGFGLADAFVSGLGVPNLAIASTDFELLINAMKSQGRLQVLSNPSVMAANNEQARIQVGETIRLPTDVSVTDAGRTLTSVEAEEIGVILEVRPSINPDGFVRMVINPEISNLSARTTRISEEFESPIITKREATTTVTVQDGQTIVLGGLISDRFERRDRKVPLLGDIPILGGLFRAEQEQSAKTELLIVLTPHVIQSPAEVHRIRELTGDEIDRLTVPPEVRDAIRRNTGRPSETIEIKREE